MFCLPENLRVVSGLWPQVGAAAAVVGDYISLKNAQMCWAVIHYHQADATQITFIVNRATAVAPTGAVVITNVVPIWANEDCVASDTLVRQTDAVNFQGDANTPKDKLVIFQIDPASLGSTYDCIAVGTSTAIAATSWIEITYYIQPRVEANVANQQAFITD
jgi:hypothetical protein